MEIVPVYSSASNDDFDGEPLLKKLCVFLCMPPNAPEYASEHLKLLNFLGEHAPRLPYSERLHGGLILYFS